MSLASRALRLILLALVGLAVPGMGLSGRAQAAPEVVLKPRPVSRGVQITLADIFDGVRGPAGAIMVARAAPAGSETVLDAADVQTKVRVAGYEWSNAEGAARITVGSMAGPVSRTAPKPSAVAHHPSVLVYARNIRAGDLIRPEDLRWSADAIASGDALSDPDEAAGKAARRPLREGAPSLQSDLAAQTLIHRDDIVSVSFSSDGISLVLQGKALGDATRGQTVEVMNTASKKIIEAVCSGPGQAAVGPAAEQLKASQGAASYVTAAR
jgi:flagella basal body P-ring formation protein FlgA